MLKCWVISRGGRGQGDGDMGSSDFSAVQVVHPGSFVAVKFEGVGLEAGTLVVVGRGGGIHSSPTER